MILRSFSTDRKTARSCMKTALLSAKFYAHGRSDLPAAAFSCSVPGFPLPCFAGGLALPSRPGRRTPEYGQRSAARPYPLCLFVPSPLELVSFYQRRIRLSEKRTELQFQRENCFRLACLRDRATKNAGLTPLQARQILDKTRSKGKKWPKTELTYSFVQNPNRKTLARQPIRSPDSRKNFGLYTDYSLTKCQI